MLLVYVFRVNCLALENQLVYSSLRGATFQATGFPRLLLVFFFFSWWLGILGFLSQFGMLIGSVLG